MDLTSRANQKLWDLQVKKNSNKNIRNNIFKREKD